MPMRAQLDVYSRYGVSGTDETTTNEKPRAFCARFTQLLSRGNPEKTERVALTCCNV